MVQNLYTPDGSTWNDEDIVISGISARLPNCDSVEEFQENLLAKVDLITDEPRRFQNGLYGAIKRYGLLKDLSKFDAGFFNIHPKQADRMDPQIRNLLEVAYEATLDAGLHPTDLSGTKTGVVVGVASSETQDKWSQLPDRINGYEYTGCTRTMFANRVSYFLDIKGPSYSIDTASSTTLVAFQQAYDMIRDGVCEACFVCGTDLVLNPCVCLMFQCLNMLSPEGKCKAFDISGDGYVRSEGAIAVLLQKAKHAKRVYANVLAAGSNCDGYKDEGITFPSCEMQTKLFRHVAQLAGIDPKTIDFMEAHGSATRVGDPQEMNAVTEVFTKGRKEPLRTGSIKSNMGHGEPASALSAVIKICVAMECGILPPNLHYNIPNPDIPALLDGRLKVITEPTPWDGGIVAVNSFGVGGANGHALLLSNKKLRQIVKDIIPRLVCVSGVTKSAVNTMLNKIESLPVDSNLYALLNNIHRKNIEGHEHRGFMIIDDENVIRKENIPRKFRRTPSLCFILPGLENCWKSLNPDLMKIRIFHKSIEACEKELKTTIKNVDLKSILLQLGEEKSPLNLVIGVVALQIGFVSILRDLGIISTRIIGCNVGEIAAGYADGAYTLSQAMLLAYRLGSFLQQFHYPSSIIKSDIAPRESNIPGDVSAFVNFHRDCTLYSGPRQSIIKFMERIRGREREATMVDHFVVDVFGIIRNSGCISKLENEFKKILANTVQTDQWSAEYLISALTRVTPRIEATIAQVVDPVVFVIGPETGFLRKLPIIFSMKEEACVTEVLFSIGQLFNAGFNPQIQNLYPKVRFPVPHGTPMIQSMIEWDHTRNWNVVSFAPQDNRIAGELDVVVDFDKEEFKLLKENEICAQQTFPRAFYIYLVWKAMSRFQNKSMTDFPLIIENIFFIREITVPKDGTIKFTVIVLEACGKFEIRESGHTVVSGEVRIPKMETLSRELIPPNLFAYKSSTTRSETEIDADDVYRFLNINQYQYNNTFKSITSFNYESNTIAVKTDKLLPYIESFIQLLVLNSEFEVPATRIITFIRKIVINPQRSQNGVGWYFKKSDIEFLYRNPIVNYNKKFNALKSVDIEMRGMKLKCVPFPTLRAPNVVRSKFVSFINDDVIENAAESSLVLAIGNFAGCNDLKIIEIISNPTEAKLSASMKNINPFLRVDLIFYCTDLNDFEPNDHKENIRLLGKNINTEPVDTNCHIAIAKNILRDSEAFVNLLKSIRTNGCLVLEENVDEEFIPRDDVEVIAQMKSISRVYYVLKKVNSKIRNSPRVITINNFVDCLQKLQHIPDDNQGLLIVATKSFDVDGIIPFTKSILNRTPPTNLSLMLIEDKDAPVFSLTNSVYTEQLKKNYPINVYKRGMWGAYITTSFSNNPLSYTKNAYLGLSFQEGQTSIDFVTANSAIHEHKLNSDEKVSCEVLYASVNTRDIQLFQKTQATAFSLPTAKNQDRHLGVEFAGYRGDERVFGLVSGGALGTSVVADKEYLWTIPKQWSFEEAGTIPYAYALSFYGLKIRGNIQTGSSILIIGVNSVAIAAIYIALRHECDIFLLLKDDLQIPLLRKLFPQIEGKNFIVSKDNDFHLHVLQRTAGNGVNLLFNTLPVKRCEFQSYVRSLAENGVFVYFNLEYHSEEILGSSGNMRCLTFHRITPSCFLEGTNISLRKKISQFIANGLADGLIHPLPYKTFSSNKIKDVLRYFSATKVDHASEECDVTKTIVKIERDTNGVPAHNRIYFDDTKSYVILVGNTFFGVYTTIHLISQGIRNLILVDMPTEYKNSRSLDFLLKKIKEYADCNISRVTMNEFSSKSCELILQKASQNAVLGGIFDFTQFEPAAATESIDFTGGGVLKTIIEQKIAFLSNMDVTTRKSYPSLRYFVSFSLVELDYGLADSSVLAYANGVIQNIMRSRVDSGLNATLIQWGKVGESMDDVLYNDLETSHFTLPSQSVMSCLQTMHQLLGSSEAVVSSFIVNEQVETRADSKVDVIVEGVAKFLGIKNPDSVLPTLTMLDLGLDSLIGTDIQQFLEINYGVTLSTQQVRELTFEKLKKLAENL